VSDQKKITALLIRRSAIRQPCCVPPRHG